MVTMMPSKTDLRQEAAFEQLPIMIEALLDGDWLLTERSIEKLYREVRAATRNRPPFHRRPADKRLRVLDEDVLPSVRSILEDLRTPNQLSRETIIRHFQVLHVYSLAGTV